MSCSTSPKPPATRERALACVEVLSRLVAVFAERRRQLAESVGLTDQQWQVLEEIQTEHFMPSLFARERKSSAAAVSKILRQLTDKGFIQAQVSPKDGRQRDYLVTVAGQQILHTLRSERKLAIDQVWLSLTEQQLSQFHHLGSEIAERLESFSQERLSTHSLLSKTTRPSS